LNYNPNNSKFTYYARSTNGGQSFLPPVRACDSLYESQYAFSSIAVSRDGRLVYVVRSEGNYPITLPYTVYLSRSTDGGATFVRPDVRVNADTTRNMMYPTIAAANDSVVLVAWDNRDSVIFSRSTDGGSSFGPNLVLSDTVVGGLCPSIAVDDSGRVYVVWTHGNEGLGLAVSRNLGFSFPYPGVVPYSWDGGYPSIWATRDGRLFVAWQDNGGPDQVWLGYSPNSGDTFFPSVRPSDAPFSVWAENATVCANENGKALVAWHDDRNNIGGAATDVFCTSGMLLGISERAGRGVSLLRVEPPQNPCRRRVELGYRLPEPGRVSGAVYDQAGRQVKVVANAQMPAGTHSLVWNGTTETGRSAGSGVYFLELRTESENNTYKVVFIGN
jgi:hypothetical protein